MKQFFIVVLTGFAMAIGAVSLIGIIADKTHPPVRAQVQEAK